MFNEYTGNISFFQLKWIYSFFRICVNFFIFFTTIKIFFEKNWGYNRTTVSSITGKFLCVIWNLFTKIYPKIITFSLFLKIFKKNIKNLKKNKNINNLYIKFILMFSKLLLLNFFFTTVFYSSPMYYNLKYNFYFTIQIFNKFQ